MGQHATNDGRLTVFFVVAVVPSSPRVFVILLFGQARPEGRKGCRRRGLPSRAAATHRRLRPSFRRPRTAKQSAWTKQLGSTSPRLRG